MDHHNSTSISTHTGHQSHFSTIISLHPSLHTHTVLNRPHNHLKPSIHTHKHVYTDIITHFKPHRPALTLSSHCHSELPITMGNGLRQHSASHKRDNTRATPPTYRRTQQNNSGFLKIPLGKTLYIICIYSIMHLNNE